MGERQPASRRSAHGASVTVGGLFDYASEHEDGRQFAESGKRDK